MVHTYSARAQGGSMDPAILSSGTLMEQQQRGWVTVFSNYILIGNV